MDGRWCEVDEVVGLAHRVGVEAKAASLIGAGHWSDCYELLGVGRRLVLRVGESPGDFKKDRFFGQLLAGVLPVPQVHHVDRVPTQPGAWFAISDQVAGSPLELAEHWPAVIGSVAELLASLRDAPLEAAAGGWGFVNSDGRGRFASWSEFLTSVGVEASYPSIAGWRAAVAAQPEVDEFFVETYATLVRLVSDNGVELDIRRSLAHCDLLNRNVHVLDGRIEGLFDWGNAIYGDHLYNLAAFHFWQPWFPHVRAPVPTADVADIEIRLAACYLHLGLEHLGYSAFIGQWNSAVEIIERLRTLVPGLAHDGGGVAARGVG